MRPPEPQDLVSLRQGNGRRLQTLNGQGVVVNGLTEGYLAHLLRAIIVGQSGWQELDALHFEWETEVSGKLDAVEAEVAKQRLLAPLGQPAPNGRTTNVRRN